MGNTVSCFRIFIAVQRRRSGNCVITQLFARIATSPHIHKNEETINQTKFDDDPVEQAVKRTADDTSDNKNGDHEERGEEEEKRELSEKVKEEEEEEVVVEEEERQQQLRRSSSLKRGNQTSPVAATTKKIVRFADVLGLDLADVRTFFGGIPKIPNSAYSDLMYDKRFDEESSGSPVNFWGTMPVTFMSPSCATATPHRSRPNVVEPDRTSMVPLFQQPGGSSSFLNLVRERLVCLENVVVEDEINLAMHGTVRVWNLDFHKSVQVRYTVDSWQSSNNLEAIHVPNSCDGISDQFHFHLYCHTLKIGQRLELAVRYRCKDSEYWDNNSGINYCFQCLPATSNNTGHMPIPTSMNITDSLVQSISHSNSHDCSATFC